MLVSATNTNLCYNRPTPYFAGFPGRAFSRFAKAIAFIGLTLGLSACGGGGGGSGSATVSGISSYTVGGTLTGLAAGNSITVANNGTDNTILSANGAFTFSAKLTSGTSYNLSIVTLPVGQPCTYTYGAGTVSVANVTNINLFCGPASVNAWTAAGSLTTGRFNHTATLLPNGKVLAAGGRGALASAELYW